MEITHTNYQELVEDIRNFIEKEKTPDTIIEGYFQKLDPVKNHATIILKQKFQLKRNSLLLINNFMGTVIDVYGNRIIVEFKKDPNKLLEKEVKIDTSRNNVILKRLDKTLDKIEDGYLDEFSRKFLDFLVLKGKPNYKKIESIDSTNLNSSQSEAVEKSWAANDFHLIVGPPGTGKTHVINELIQKYFKNDCKLLLTAWTNVSVDNILERIQGIDKDLIIRVGPTQSISSTVTEYSLDTHKEKHPLWNDVEEHEKIIKKAYGDIGEVNAELDIIQNLINKLIEQKSAVQSKMDEFIQKRDKYKSASQFKPKTIKKSYDLKIKEEKILNLEKSSDNYYALASNIANYKNLEKTLPPGEYYYNLESEIEELNKKKSIKKISSIFSSNKYQAYLNDINQKESLYKKITDGYSKYWQIRDKADKEYSKLYGGGNGKPDEDGLKCELGILDTFDIYLDLKKKELTSEMEYNKDKLIYESYINFLKSMEGYEKTFGLEIKNFNTQIYLLINKKDKLNGIISNIRNTILKHQSDQLEIIRTVEQEILDKARIIATTVVSSAQYLLDQEQYDVMIMDEASQVATYMSLISLLKCRKFILVGDHKQLQPIGEERLKSDLNISIFNRLISLYPDDYSFLDTQYRMNQEIAELANHLFYDGKLKTHLPVSNQTLDFNIELPINELIQPQKALTYVDTSGVEYFEEGIGQGCENIYEADLAVEIVETLLNHMDPSQIGVITPYVKQKVLINNKLNNPKVEVDTVHRFQGREKEVIILSFCKSKIGMFSSKFIGDPNQINVAISRAKKKLIIIGNSRTLKQSNLIKKLLDLIGEENTIYYQDS